MISSILDALIPAGPLLALELPRWQAKLRPLDHETRLLSPKALLR